MARRPILAVALLGAALCHPRWHCAEDRDVDMQSLKRSEKCRRSAKVLLAIHGWHKLHCAEGCRELMPMTPPTCTESPKVQTTQNSVVETQQEQLKGRSGLVSAGSGSLALLAVASEDCRCGSGTWGWSAHCRACVRQRPSPGSVTNLQHFPADDP